MLTCTDDSVSLGVFVNGTLARGEILGKGAYVLGASFDFFNGRDLKESLSTTQWPASASHLTGSGFQARAPTEDSALPISSVASARGEERP